jgi:response regulator NasT
MSLKVMLVDDDPGRAIVLKQALSDAGHRVVGCFGIDEDLPPKVTALDPDVIVIDMAAPGRDALEGMHRLHGDTPRPIVMFSEDAASATIHAAVRAGVSAYIVDGLQRERITPILEVAIARFREFQALRDELAEIKHTLAERKLVDRAKGILMEQRGLDEEAAYQALRRMAMERRRRVGEVARDVIDYARMLI